jgi:hypothetical protein
MLGCMRAGINGSALTDTLKKMAAAQSGFYKNYDAATDKDVYKTLMTLYFSKCANVFTSAKSLITAMLMSLRSRARRVKYLPILPNPFIPICFISLRFIVVSSI